MKSTDARVTIKVLGYGALCASAALYVACTDDSTSPTPALDAGAGGFDATTPSPEAGTTDAAAGDSGVDAGPQDSGVDAPWCGNQRDGGALCASGQWRSFPPPAVDAGDAGASDAGSGTCNACPTAPLTCAGAVLTIVDGGPSFAPPVYSTTDHLLKVTIPPGQLEIVSVTDATVVMGTSCFGSPTATGLSGAQPVPVSVDGNTVTFDLSGTDAGSGSSIGPCGALSFTVHDACCTTSQVTVNAYYDLEQGRITNGSCPDGG
ncbi:MAG: hypothetical protein U0235_02145 [Polyangiaceae bacterium]